MRHGRHAGNRHRRHELCTDTVGAQPTPYLNVFTVFELKKAASRGFGVGLTPGIQADRSCEGRNEPINMPVGRSKP